MNNKFLLLLFILLTSSVNSFANDQYISIQAKTFILKGDNLNKKVQDIFHDPENVLKEFKFVGLKELRRNVSGNLINADLSVDLLFATKNILLNGLLTIQKSTTGCKVNEESYHLVFDLNQSSPGLVKNIRQVESQICLNFLSFNSAQLVIYTKVKKGEAFSSMYGFILKDTLADQIDSMMKTIQKQVKTN